MSSHLHVVDPVSRDFHVSKLGGAQSMCFVMFCMFMSTLCCVASVCMHVSVCALLAMDCLRASMPTVVGSYELLPSRG